MSCVLVHGHLCNIENLIVEHQATEQTPVGFEQETRKEGYSHIFGMEHAKVNNFTFSSFQ
jgi:hypothetical protein